MGILTPKDMTKVRVSAEDIAHLRQVWYTDTGSYWEALRTLYPKAAKDREVCRAVSSKVWEGTEKWLAFWGEDA